MRNAQLLQGNEPLHKALVTALESRCTTTAIVGGVLACEVPGGGMRYSRGQKKRHPLKMDRFFSLGLNHSVYVKNEQNPPYIDL